MINFTIYDKIGVTISILMVVILFTMSFKVSGLILQNFEWMGFFQIWLFFSWYYIVNMTIRGAVLIKNRIDYIIKL